MLRAIILIAGTIGHCEAHHVITVVLMSQEGESGMLPSHANMELNVMRALLLCLSCLLTPIWAFAASYVAGDAIKPITLLDQHDKAINVTDETQVLLFSRSMKGGDIIKESLQSLTGKQSLEQVVYVADISGMPSLIAKFVAIPQMQDLPFAIGLDREGEVSRALPDTKDMATMILLDKRNIVEIAYFESTDALSQALTKQAHIQ